MRPLDAPIYAPLAPALARLPRDRWPTHAELTSAAEGLSTARGKQLRFVPPREHADRYYEVHIAETGEIETRPENWHDLFNALSWLTYPRAKAAINAQHAAILEERGDAEAKHRGPERDALTLFDEGGVAVMSNDPSFFELIRDFEWKQLFWDRREALSHHVRFLPFGHALFEQALEPYLGMIAKTVFLEVDALPSDEALTAVVDRALVTHFKDRSRFPNARAMAPMPVLGVPGWYSRTGEESFYDDRKHFRAKSRR